MTPRFGKLLIGLLAAPLAISLCGCAFISWSVAQFSPPQEVKAIYKPPAGKTILVFVDDILHPVGYEPVKAELTERLNEQLTTQNTAGETIPYERLLNLIAATPQFDQLSISEVGRRLGADIVLYVQVEEFSLKDSPASPLWRGRFAATVRMVDVEVGRLWPEDRPGGYPVEPVEISARQETSPTYGAKLARDLAESLAEKIAKLFYDHSTSVRPKWDQ